MLSAIFAEIELAVKHDCDPVAAGIVDVRGNRHANIIFSYRDGGGDPRMLQPAIQLAMNGA
jgi:hypothetical protein